MTINTSICIIGAGPAGATTSLFLSKMHIPHVILDAAVFPRDKICGDALDLKVMRVLNNWQPGIVEGEILPNPNFSFTKGVLIHLNENKHALLEYLPGKGDPALPYFAFCKRAYFDNFLVSKIDPEYATFLPGTKVTNIEYGATQKTIFARRKESDITIKAALVVGADGDHSVVLKSLGERQVNRRHYAGGLRQYWKGISGLSATRNYLELYLPPSLPLSYLWIFPLPNGEANVGCGLMGDLIAKNKVDLKQLLHQIITEDPVMKERFKAAAPLEKPRGWGLPMASLRRKAHGDGWLLAGDAASLVCPTTGEGIGPAMMSGYIAAHFIQRAVANNDFSAVSFTHYDREIWRRLEGDIRNYKWFRKLSPRLFNFFINTIAPHPLCRRYFRKNVGKWIRTAFEKSAIPVSLD